MVNQRGELGDSLTLAFELVIPTLLGAVGGYYLDRHFNASPIFLFFGVLLGAGMGFYNVIRKYLKDPDTKEKR